MYFCQNLQSDHLRTSQGQIFLIIPSRSLSQHQKWKSSPIEIDWDLLFHIRKIFFWFLYNLTEKSSVIELLWKLNLKVCTLWSKKIWQSQCIFFCQGCVWAYSPCQSIIFEVSPGFEGEKTPERGTGMIHGNPHAKLWNNLSCKYYCQKEVERTKCISLNWKAVWKGEQEWFMVISRQNRW